MRLTALIGVFVTSGCHLVAPFSSSEADGAVVADAAAEPDTVIDAGSGVRDLGDATSDGNAGNAFSMVQLPNGGTVQRLSLVRNDSANLYAIVSTTRLFRSTDHAASWTACKSPGGRISAVATISDQPQQVLIGTSEVLLSRDRCQSWRPAGLYQRTHSLISLAENHYLAGTNDGLRVYEGGMWTRIESPLDGHRVERIVVDASGQHLFAASSTGGVLHSQDGASSWQLANDGLPREDIMDLAIDATHPQRAFVLFTEGIGLYRTTNGGDSWSETMWLGGRTVAVDPHDSDFLAIYLWHRLTASSDGGVHFVPGDLRTPNMGYALVDALHFDPEVTHRLYAGTNAGLFVATNRDWQWNSAHAGMSAWSIHGIATNADRRRVYLATSAGVLRSLDQGAPWTVQTTGLDPKSFAHAVTLSPDGATLWVTGEYIARSTDGGETFKNVFTPKGADDYNVNVIAVSDSHLYAGTSKRLLVSADNGTNWVPHTIAGSPRLVNDIVLAAGSTNRVWVATSAGVFFSDNYGASFTAQNQDLGNEDVQALALLDDGQLLAGTASGVYALAHGTTTWTPRGLAATEVSDLMPLQDKVVAACSSGVYSSSDRGSTWAPLTGLEDKSPRSLGTGVQGNLLVGTTGFGLHTRPSP